MNNLMNHSDLYTSRSLSLVRLTEQANQYFLANRLLLQQHIIPATIMMEEVDAKNLLQQQLKVLRDQQLLLLPQNNMNSSVRVEQYAGTVRSNILRQQQTRRTRMLADTDYSFLLDGDHHITTASAIPPLFLPLRKKRCPGKVQEDANTAYYRGCKSLPPGDNVTEGGGEEEGIEEYTLKRIAGQLSVESFPYKIFRLIEEAEKEGHNDIISFLPNGRSFVIHKPNKFLELMPKYFTTSRMASFQRQLNLYGFRRITEGPDAGGYFHKFFLRGRRGLCCKIKRQQSKVPRSMADMFDILDNPSSSTTDRALHHRVELLGAHQRNMDLVGGRHHILSSFSSPATMM